MSKRLFLALCLAAGATVARGQEIWAPFTGIWQRLDGGPTLSLGYQFVVDETTTLTSRSKITFLGSVVTCVDNAANAATECTFTSGSGYSTVQDEGGALTQRPTINFIGAGVTCVDNAGATKTDCTISGASATGYQTVKDEGGASLTQRTTLNCTGAGITCSDDAGNGWTTINVPAAAGAVTLQGSSPGTPDSGNWSITGIGLIRHNALATTPDQAFNLINSTAAANGAQQYSPDGRYCGTGWNSGGSASEIDCWRIFARPVQGNPSTVDLVFQSSINSGSFVQQMYMQSNGHLSLGLSGTTDGSLTLLGATSGSISLAVPAGALGGRTLTLPAATDTLVGQATTDTLSNKTLVAPILGTPASGTMTNVTGLPLTTGVTGTLPAANGGTGNATNTIHGVMVGNAASALSVTAAGASGTALFGVTGADPAFQTGANTNYPGLLFNPSTTAVGFEDFYGHGATGGGTTYSSTGQCMVVGSGSGSGVKTAAGTNAIASDANSPGVLTLTTGTTATGRAGVYCGTDIGTDTVTRIPLNTGAIFETRVYIPVASGAGAPDTFENVMGFCDATTSHCNNGFGVYVGADASPNNHWGCYTALSSSRTSTLSSTVATAGAWHTIRATLTTAGSSAAFTVDGVALSCSPLATNVPTAGTTTSIANSITASAGCAANTTCLMGTDYIYWYLPGISR